MRPQRRCQTRRFSSDYTEAYNNRGAAYYYKRDYTRARTDWEEVLQINPFDIDAWTNLERLQSMGY
ncbi:MAG: tetratricopeptide repeat protein [Treponema sp.]|nr:tetratricopeptide repeat protein [Treponema sp.]